MKIIKPTLVTDANFVYSNVPEDDAPVWGIATPYDIGDEVMLDHVLYQAAEASTGVDPSLEANRVKWPIMGMTNRWRMFDMTRGTEIRTIYPSQVVVEIALMELYSAVALFGISAKSVTIEIINGSNGVVYTNELDVVSNVGVNTFFEWYFGYSQRLRTSSAVDLELPYYPGATLRVTVDNPGADAEIGKLVFGKTKDLGCTSFGIEVRYLDFSPRERDTFGNLVARPNRRIISQRTFPVKVDSALVESVEATFKQLGGAPTVFIGSPNHSVSVIFGVVLDFSASYAYRNTNYSLKVEEF